MQSQDIVTKIVEQLNQMYGLSAIVEQYHLVEVSLVVLGLLIVYRIYEKINTHKKQRR